ncbi:hypothetical protein A1Q1_00186 [Trichosporon asahii var. asahii CBS 2479]|uniref:Protein YOP1 n=1 Tax=Trichosporon asahii var. asahii (strain ATCC 90039 / CBS 2479 / JCM 2466 / KCTC 7840 / NBRC 103889/ NCYC 2677 / UAMH 7654) TaxID=1186058 RepID=J5R3I7_TRIAS|nr:hypothetical protein A1Q1_00186 [Trichosporon asahii var. asahii CBS 2479]EJT50488.1 hypothetical protein A1Q1_00186 [Trichosporon asahii var. asahii CBS 2479]
MSSPGSHSTPAVPPSTPDASFAPQLPPPQLGKLDISNTKSNSNASTAPPSKNVLRKSVSSHPAYKRAQEAADSARRQVGKLRKHPTAVRASDACAKQAQNARDLLGRSEAVVDAERITGIDRLFLVFAGLLLFIAFVPANLLGLAAPATTAIVAVRPTYHSYRALTDEKEDVKHLLTFYVALGLFQTVEGCVPTWVLDRIPRYYMCKLILLTYLGHPRFKVDDWQKRITKQQSQQPQQQQPLQQPEPLRLHVPYQAQQTYSSSTPTPPCDSPVGRSPSPLAAFGVTVDTQAPPENKYVSSDAVRNGSVKNWVKTSATSAIPRPTMH